MSDERIDHAAEARECLAATVEGNDYAEVVSALHAKMTGAQAHATLALVEQQCIANLIALAQPVRIPGGGEVSYDIYKVEYGNIGDVTRCELRPEIREALGLRE